MRSLIALLSFLALSSVARAGIELKSGVQAVSAGAVDYSFELYDSSTLKNLGDGDLAIDMEKKLHLIVYDPSLQEFQHLHPEFDGTSWHVRASFAVNGEYWVWAQGKVARSGAEFSSPTRLTVTGGNSAWPAPPVLGDVRSGRSGNSMVELSQEEVHAGRMTMLDVTFSRMDGSAPELSPYLGAFAHVVAVSNAGETLEHVHPMDSGDNTGMLHATFKEPGDYRLWIQFIDGGELKVIPLSIRVIR